ncbi:hypothetical protein QQW99_19590 [Bacillus amyloliquefaciens]|uniref:hypothetical protein n=1 Tax=Bacillus amyloliquefaciens TaxID=1390 RepID=UPI00255B7C9C|nr:hypothetical protein [Bacillus amyloliquefaciens]WIX29280.1 hypothetical protein QQW99_19590 [Bacillus amyloliquefaciens]
MANRGILGIEGDPCRIAVARRQHLALLTADDDGARRRRRCLALGDQEQVARTRLRRLERAKPEAL